MSTTLPTPPAVGESATDPFRFGWRYVTTTGPDGQSRTEMVPLTLEEALHPREEDRYMITDAHDMDRVYLRSVFTLRLADTPGAVVLSDCRVAWDAEGTYAHGPDVAVVFNVAERQNWATFNVVHEETRPALIVEIVSPSTRTNDVADKVREYAEVGVPRYVIVDVDENGSRSLSFVHYQLPAGGGEYEEVPVSANGRVWLPEVKLWLVVDGGRVACFDPRGRRLGDYTEVTRAKEAAEERAEAAAERVAAAEQAITAEVEARMADTRARREAERRAAEAEARLKEMAAELDRLRAGDAGRP